jgi:DNA-binding MarR family transcriptional regulator
MEKVGKGASVYLKFLNLVNALDSSQAFPTLDATEEKLLQQLAAAWGADKRITVLETMGMDADVSATTIHRRLKSLSKKGIISLAMDEQDNRVKYVLPTALATDYFAKLSKCLVAATKGR